jgi:hypothetical protein
MLPKSLDAVLLRGLSKNPRERYPSALEFHRELCKALRPIAQLPYSQIFARPQPAVHPAPQQKTPGTTLASQRTLTGDPKLQPTASSRDRAEPEPTAALGELDLEGRTATLQPESAGSPAAAAAESAPPVSVPATRAPAYPAIAPVSEPLPRRRAMAWLLGGAGVVIVAAVVSVVALKSRTNTSNDLRGGAAPRVTPSVQAVAPTPAVPSPAPVIQRKLTWLPDQESVSREYTVGDYVSAWWCVESAEEAALPPAWYAVELGQGAGEVTWSARTQEQQLAIPLEKGGSYTLTVRALDAEGQSVGSLETGLKVRER